MFKYPGDPTTPGFASTVTLPESQRVPPEKAVDMPKIPTTPLSYGDAQPILRHLAGPESPRDWQGALPFTYHMGPGPVRVHVNLKQDYEYRTIWNVIGGVCWTVGILLLGYFLGTVSFLRGHIEVLVIAVVVISLIPLLIEAARRRPTRPAAAVDRDASQV